LVQAYNPTNNKWRMRARLPAARMDVAAVAAEARLYAVGGASPTLAPTRTLYSYNPGSNRWTSRAPMPSSLTGVAAAAGDNAGNTEIFVFEIGRGAGSAVSTTFIYDTGTNSWVAGHALPSAVSHAQAVRVGSSIYVLGGLDTTGQPSLSVFIYDIASDSFSAGAAMAMNSFGPIGATAGKDGRIYAVGLDWSATRVDAYNPISNLWTGSPPNLLHPQAYPAMGRIGTRIYAAGGNPANLTITSDTLEALKVT
jgi:Kelch motif.